MLIEHGIAVLDSPAAAAAVLDPVRREMLRALATPNSASSAARHLKLPRQKANYHLRELEKAGLIRFVEERRRGNCVERVFQASASAYVISPDVLGALGGDPDSVQDRFSEAYLLALAGRVISDLGELRRRADAEGKRLATLAIQTEVRFADAAAQHGFAEELANEVARLVAKYHDAAAPGGRSFRFVIGGHPALKRDGELNTNPTHDTHPTVDGDRA